MLLLYVLQSHSALRPQGIPVNRMTRVLFGISHSDSKKSQTDEVVKKSGRLAGSRTQLILRSLTWSSQLGSKSFLPYGSAVGGQTGC